MNRYPHSIAVAAGLLAFLAASGSPIAGEEPTRAQKTVFLSALCDGLENAERCLSSGRIVLDLSLDWVMFEACSYPVAGQRTSSSRILVPRPRPIVWRSGFAPKLPPVPTCR